MISSADIQRKQSKLSRVERRISAHNQQMEGRIQTVESKNRLNELVAERAALVADLDRLSLYRDRMREIARRERELENEKAQAFEVMKESSQLRSRLSAVDKRLRFMKDQKPSRFDRNEFDALNRERAELVARLDELNAKPARPKDKAVFRTLPGHVAESEPTDTPPDTSTDTSKNERKPTKSRKRGKK